MHCEYVDLGNGHTAIACFRGPRKPVQKCAWCANPSTRLCDGKPPAGERRKSCDKPMCEDHRYKLDEEHDLCPRCRAIWTGEEVVINGVTLKP